MVAVIAGAGTGLERSSASILGLAGQVGQASFGRAGDNVYVNAATGNLIVQNTDEMLIGLGVSDVVSRTYNSMGTFTANRWQESTQRAVTGLVGTVNTQGSTIKHTTWDGTVVTYTYSVDRGAYLAYEDNGAQDLLSFSGTTWTWTDGTTGTIETYDSANGGRLVTRKDLDNNTLTYTYTGGLLTKVTTQDGEFTTLNYTANGLSNNLTSITTTNASAQTLTRVRYGYDSSNRLTTVTVDLTPGDNSITDGNTYVTTYGYDSTSTRIASITQSDGSSLAITYTTGSGPRVASITQSMGAGQTSRVTTFTYGLSTGTTTITDPLGLQTVLAYDTSQRLTKITTPLSGGVGSPNQNTQFTYNSATGQVATIVPPAGNTITYTYDTHGNRLSQTDTLGDLVTWTYGTANQRLTETRTPSQGVSLTTRYVYDSLLHLRYVIGAAGDVAEFRYNASGQQVSAIRYAANTYASPGTPTEAQLNTWVTGISDKSTTLRTDTTYDFRGNVASVTSFSKVLTTGVGDTGSPVSTINYVYDQTGRLLSRQQAGSSASETYAYDGLFRQTMATDLTGASTSIAFDDIHQKTVVTLANGTTQTSVYDLAGELISSSVAASGMTTATTTEAYDLDGRLRMITDPTGVKTYFLYDVGGRKVADIQANGSIVEYRYDLNNRLVATIQYKNLLTGTQLASLVSSGQPANVTLASVLPTADAGDRWTWSVYDAANRVIETIDATGAVTVLTYDKTSQVTSTTTYANVLSAATVSGFKTTPPTTLTLPTADATHDNVTRDFYDTDVRLIATLDADGHLNQIVYDAAGEQIQTIRSANAAASNLWVTGTLAQLIASVSTSSHDEITSFVYDAEGQLRFTVDGGGRVCEYVYDTFGNVVHKTEYATAITTAATYSLAYVQSHLSANGADRTTRSVYDAANRLAFSIDAQGGVVSYTYDSLGHVVKQIGFAATYSTAGDPSLATMQTWATSNASGSNHIIRAIFDAFGRAVYAVDAEGYVTESQYDLSGRVTKQIRYASVYTVTDSTTAVALATTIGSIPATAQVTTLAYDAAGRLTDVTDPMGVVTHSVLDALGQVTDSTVAYGTGDASTTHFAYDAAGRVQSQTSAYGAGEAITTSFTYDGVGRVLTSTDGRGTITTRSYDAIGQLLSVTVPLSAGVNAITSYAYDSLGNRVSMTDPRGNTGYFYYDNLNRLVTQVDPEGYVTQTSYSRGDQATSVTHYANRATNAGSLSASVQPTLSPDASHDETTYIGRDKLDRVTSTTDAQGYTESYGLDAFGNRVTVTNKLGGVTTNAYDRRGLLVSETLPISSMRSDGTMQAATVTNTFAYDARGNKVQMVEAAGLTEHRTTNYTYDLNDRLTGKTSDGGISETTKYDARGDIIETDDTAGARTLTYYDRLGRKTAQVNALGYMTTWAYDQASNVTSATTYGTAVALPGTPGGSAPGAPGGDQRTTINTYDLGNRLTSTKVSGLLVGSYSGGTYSTSTTDVIVQTVYDKSGNAIQQIDGKGASIFAFYDKAGHKVAQVDQDNYLTSFTLDADGNVLTEERFATALTASVTTSSDPAALRATVVNGAGDRVTTFTYDRNGRRLTETRKNVNGIGGGTDSIINYAYNGLGEVTLKVEATGDYTQYTYDGGGRQVAATSSGFVDYTGATVQPQTQTYYDGLNNVVRSRTGKASGAAAGDHVTTFTYSSGGRLFSTTDAAGFTTFLGYDAAGHVTDQFYFRHLSSGSVVFDDVLTQYDLLGRSIRQQTQEGTSTLGDYTTTTYDAYGEVVAKGMNGITEETYSYDGGGRMWRTTSNGGVVQLFGYDAAGNQTLEVDAAGADLSAQTAASAPSYASNSGAAVTYRVYDARGQALQTVQANRGLNASTSQTLTDTKVYNAFGEVTQDTDARNNTTNFTYNTMGKLTQQQAPTVSITSENGAVSSVRPTLNYGYDAAGRLVSSTDANGNVTTRALLAGTGYGGTEAVVVAEFHPDGGIATTKVDVFGDARQVINELGYIETRTYDGMGRVITVAHPSRTSDGGDQLVDNYTYDSQGRQLTHWNSQLGDDVTQRTDYDLQGRVVQEIDFGGHVTAYGYVWNGSLTTSGVGAFGGWTKTTVIADGTKSSGDSIDYFGRTVAHTDFGGHYATMAFDTGGRLISQVAVSTGQNLAYTYFNTGKVATLVDAASAQTTTYGYDAAGNQTSEAVAGSSTYYDPLHGCSVGGLTTLQNSATTYDALNRMITLTDSGMGGGPAVSISYEYDANGNIRHIGATYTDIVTNQANSTQDDWYRYDAMNRFVTTKGTLNGARGSGTIVRGNLGVDIAYNAAGERVSATSTMQQDIQVAGHFAPPTSDVVVVPGHYTAAYHQNAYYAWECVPAHLIPATHTDGYYETVVVSPGHYEPGPDIPGDPIYDSCGNIIGYNPPTPGPDVWVDEVDDQVWHDPVDTPAVWVPEAPQLVYHAAVDIPAGWVPDSTAVVVQPGAWIPASTVHAGTDHAEYYRYTEDGYLQTVSISDGGYDTNTNTVIAPSLATATLRGLDVRDAMGRVTGHYEFTPGTGPTATTIIPAHEEISGHYETQAGYTIPAQHVDGYYLFGCYIPPVDIPAITVPDSQVWVNTSHWVDDTYINTGPGNGPASPGAYAVFSRLVTYDNNSNETSERTANLNADGSIAVTTTTFQYGAPDASGNGTGAYWGGVVTHSVTSFATIAKGPSLYQGMEQWLTHPETLTVNSSDTKTAYVWWDRADQSQITYKPNTASSTTNTTTFTYTGDGRLLAASISDGRPRRITYVDNSLGQIISRIDSTGPRDYYYNFAGMQRGDISNNGKGPSDTDYATAIAARQAAAQNGAYRYGSAQSFADFDQSYVPINPASDGQTGSSYTVRDGDTLQSIATQMWGDASLWYLIADANGLTGTTPLAAGMNITLPNKVTNLHNDSATFRVYDPNKAVGDVQPNVPQPDTPQPAPSAPKKKHGCGIAQIIVAIVAVAVTVVTSGAAASFFATSGGLAGGAFGAGATVLGSGGVLVASSAGVAGLLVGGAVGSIVSQGVAMALGVQSKFSWSQVGLSAVGNLVGGELGGVKGLSGNSIGGSTFLTGAVRGAVGSVITQGIGVATGLQSHFDWTGVAVAGIGGGVTNWAGSRLAANFKSTFAQGSMANTFVSGMAGDIAGAATRSLLTGTDFGDNILADLPSVIGNTIGNSLASNFLQTCTTAQAPQAKDASATVAAQKTRALGADDTYWNLATADMPAGTADDVIAYRTQQYLQANPGIDPMNLEAGQNINVPNANLIVSASTLNLYNDLNLLGKDYVYKANVDGQFNIKYVSAKIDFDTINTDNGTSIDFATTIKAEGGVYLGSYVPWSTTSSALNNSGVTLAGGIDLGGKRASNFPGASQDIIDLLNLSTTSSLHKQPALTWNKSNQIWLSPQQAVDLQTSQLNGQVRDIVSWWHQNSPNSDFSDLTPAQQSVVFERAYNSGTGSHSVSQPFYRQALQGNWTAAAQALTTMAQDRSMRTWAPRLNADVNALQGH